MGTVVSPNKPDSALDGRPVLRCPNRFMNMAVPALGPKVPVAVIQDATDDSSSGRREGDPGVSGRPTNCMDSREFLSKLMADLRQPVHQGLPGELGRDTTPLAPPEVVALLRQMGSPVSTSTDMPSSGTRGTKIIYFSYDRSEHGVSRCSRVDTSLFASGTVNIGQRGPRFSLETPIDPGGRVSLLDQ